MTAEIGRVLGGRYRLVAPIGLGASAQVFLADDVRLRRRVAVKMLQEALADDESFLRRFRAEARAAAALSHPNVLAVYDWGDDDLAFSVTAYLGGGSLRSLLDQGHVLSLSQALAVGLDAARALDYAHRRGFVHRDIKPANILFGEEQRLRIADFGLARALAEAAWTEPQGAMLGTARYASPEQAKGEKLSGKADVYALALVIIESVTGDVPFRADTTLGMLIARVDRELPVPEAMGPLTAVLRAAGHPDPEQRIDARSLAAGLLRAAKELPRPAPLPLVGALASASELKADPNPTTIAPPPVEPDPSDVGPEMTEEDLGLDPPDWVSNAAPPLAVIAGLEAAGALPAIDPEPDEERVALLADDETDDETDHDLASDDEGADADGSEGDDRDEDRDDAEPTDPIGADDEDLEPDDEGDDDGAAGFAPVAPPAVVIHPDRTRITGAERAEDGDATRIIAAPTAPPNGPFLDHGDEHDDDEDGAESGRRRRWPWIAAVLLLLIGGAGIAAAVTYDPPQDQAQRPVLLPVPSVAGLDVATATRVLDAAGWTVETETERKNDTTAGQIIDLTPAPGTRLAKGRTITMVVSEGQEMVALPQGLVGRPVDEVVARFAEVGLQAVVGSEVHHEDVPAGGLIQYADGTPADLERGSKVELVVSRGPRPRTVPTGLAGKPLATARELIQGEQLKAKVEEAFSDTVAEGTVISQSPAGGAEVPRGSAVTIVVSKGPELVSVPDVSWTTTVAQASQVLRQRGLTPGTVSGPAEGTPKSTSPAFGTQVRKGATVNIIVG